VRTIFLISHFQPRWHWKIIRDFYL